MGGNWENARIKTDKEEYNVKKKGEKNKKDKEKGEQEKDREDYK